MRRSQERSLPFFSDVWNCLSIEAEEERAVIAIQETELVAAAERGVEAFFRGIKKDHNPFTLTMFAARVRGDRAVLLSILAAAWWFGWDQANDAAH